MTLVVLACLLSTLPIGAATLQSKSEAPKVRYGLWQPKTAPTANSGQSAGHTGTKRVRPRTRHGARRRVKPRVIEVQHHRIHRSEAAKRAFERKTGHPHGWPGHVVDHIVPLACGGADAPSNMQWQTIAAGKAKDKVERKNCKP